MNVESRKEKKGTPVKEDFILLLVLPLSYSNLKSQLLVALDPFYNRHGQPCERQVLTLDYQRCFARNISPGIFKDSHTEIQLLHVM